jgi:hypothetical protein
VSGWGRRLRHCKVVSALTVGLALGIPQAALASKAPSWEDVRSSLISAGLPAQRDVTKAAPDHDAVTGAPDSTPYWFVWVFKGAGVRDGATISGSRWSMDLNLLNSGTVYWTDFVRDAGAQTGSYTAVKLYGDNLALVTRFDRHRETGHALSLAQMPGTWIALDEALSKLTGTATGMGGDPKVPSWWPSVHQTFTIAVASQLRFAKCPVPAVGGRERGLACAAGLSAALVAGWAGVTASLASAGAGGVCVLQRGQLVAAAARSLESARSYRSAPATAKIDRVERIAILRAAVASGDAWLPVQKCVVAAAS